MLKDNSALKKLLLNNTYLVAIAACLITISFILDNYWAGTSSAATVKKNITSFIQQQESDFNELSKDTLLINKLATQKYDEQTLQEVTAKKYFLYVYALNDSGLYNIIFWNNHLIEPAAYLLTQPTNTGFVLKPD